MTTMVWPSTFSSSAAVTRVTWSVEPPAAHGTIRLIGRVGFHSAADADVAPATATMPRAESVCESEVVSLNPPDETYGRRNRRGESASPSFRFDVLPTNRVARCRVTIWLLIFWRPGWRCQLPTDRCDVDSLHSASQRSRCWRTKALSSRCGYAARTRSSSAAWPGLRASCRVQAPDAFQQTLAAQHFVATGDAARETVGHVEQRSIAVGDLRVEREPAAGQLDASPKRLDAFEHIAGALGLDAPMPEQAAVDPQASQSRRPASARTG